MTRQLVVVVHGVGVRQAGVTTDIIASALVAVAPEPDTAEVARPPLRPVSADDVHLYEAPRYSRGGLRSTFPARIRRYRRDAGPDRAPQERVVADFYWGDVAATGDDAPRLALGLLRAILGLAHVIRESACEVFASDSAADRRGRQLAVLAPLVLHGPILALNLVLLVAVLVELGLRAGLGLVLDPVSGAGLVGAVAVGAGLGLQARAASYLERLLWSWVVLTGLAVLAMAGSGAAGLAFETRLAQAWGLLGAMLALWGLAVGLAGAAGLLAALRRRRDPLTPPPLILPVFGLMTCLWFVAISAVWAALLSGAVPGGAEALTPAERDLIHLALAGILPAVVALVLLILTGLAVHLAKRRALRAVPEAGYDSHARMLDHLSTRWRLIVAPALGLVLVAFLAASVVLAVALALWPGLAETLSEATRQMLGVLVLVLGLVLASMRGPFAMGLAIVTDIILWLNDYSWRVTARGAPPRTFEPVPMTRMQQIGRGLVPAPHWGGEPGTAAGTGAAPAANPAQDDLTPRGYWLRQRIRERFRVLMTALLRDENPDRIVVIAHSQGTMIALDVLRHEGANWRLRKGETGNESGNEAGNKAGSKTGGTDAAPPRDLRLVTMGSPARHLYHHYFPAAFPAPQAQPELAPVGSGGVLAAWVNIFRIDDFVGTRISPPPDGPDARPGGSPGAFPGTWPAEHPVGPRGHTNYALDDAVIARLMRELEF